MVNVDVNAIEENKHHFHRRQNDTTYAFKDGLAGMEHNRSYTGVCSLLVSTQ